MKEKYIVYFISKTRKKMVRFIEQALKARGIEDVVPSYGNILTALYDAGGALSMKAIAEKIGKEKSTVTALVGKLEALNYVEKVRCEVDKRVTYVSLTPKGRALETPFAEISNAVQATAYRGFSEAEKTEFLRLLKKMQGNFDTEA